MNELIGLLEKTGLKAVQQSVRAGTVLYHRHDLVDTLYAVLKGRVRLLRDTVDGHMITLHTARAGEFLNEPALFAERYHCSALVDIDSYLLAYSTKQLLAKFAADAALATRFMAQQAALTQRLRTLLELRNIRSARERVLHYLYVLGEQGCIQRDRPLKTMASEIGLSHEVFYRTLATLEKSGLIQRTAQVLSLKV